MKINKRLLSFFLAVLMVFSTFGETVYALSSSNETGNRSVATELEGKVEGNKEVFTFDLSKFKSKESVAPMTTKAMPARAPRRAPIQWDTEVNITTTGLNGKAFDWTALPNKEFKLIAKWETTDGQKHEKEITTITDTSDKNQFANVGWPVDGTMKGNASVVTNYNGNIEVRIVIVSASGIGGSGRLTFDVTIKELAEPRVNVEYIDPYGRPITDPADLPSATDTMPKVTADELTDVAIDLPKTSKQINMRSSDDIDDDELHEAANGLTYKVDGKEDEAVVTIGGKEYKLDISQPSAKEIGTIRMVYQKDVIVPPTKDDGSGEPVDPAEGYVRLTFDANENKQDGITGTHTAGDYAGKQKSYIDVKQGVNYDNANLQAAIKALSTTGTKLVGTETKQYAQDAKNPWTPAVPNDTTAVATATYNAQYAKSAAEQVKDLGGLDPVTIKVWKNDTIDWSKGVAPKTTNVNDKATVQQLLDNAKVTEITQPARTSDAQGKFEGKLLVTFGDKSTLEVDKQWLYVWEHIVTVDPNSTDPDVPKTEDDLPSDKIKVLFEPLANKGVKSINTTGTTYAKKGTVFQDKDFPQDITFEEGYKGPVTWTPADHTITNTRPGFVKGKGFIFRASATQETTADIVKKNGGLKGVDFAAWVGDLEKLTDDTAKSNFWKKGVAANTTDNTKKATIDAALAEATVEDTTAQKRTTDAKGTFPGTLKVTFKDGSVYEVEAAQGQTPANTNIEQKLYVYDKKDVVPTDPTQPTPEDAVVVTYKKGDGVTELQGTGKTLVKSGETLEAGDFPQATVDTANGYKEPAAWTPEDKVVTENNKTFTATAEKETTAEKVTKLGGLSPETIKVWVKDPIDWSKGVKATKDENKDKVAELLKDAAVTDKTQPERTSAAAGEFEGTLLVTFKDTSTIEVPKQMLIVSDDKVVDPADPGKLPDDKIKVEFAKGEGVTAIAEKNLYVKPNTTLVDADFPQATVDTANGYKEPAAWTPEDKVVTENNKTFTATATKKKAAEEITEAGGLKGVDLAAWVGDNLDANFWKKGAALADNVQDADGKLAALLAGATVTDKSNRTTTAKGEYPGTLTVTFADGSSLEVDQKLFVYNKKDDVPTDPTQPTPKDAVVVTYEKGDGVSELKGTGKTLVKSGETLEAGDFPEAVVDKANGYKEPATWTPEDKVVTEQNKEFTATATKNVPTTKNSEDYEPHYTDKSGKPGETVEIAPPTFTKKGEQGTVPAPTDGDKKTTFTKNDPTKTNVTVDPNTGAITVNIPQDAPVGSTITIPVDVTYPDGSNETVRVTVTVTNPDDKTKDPTIDQPYEGDKKITGKGEPESKIVVDLPDGTQVDGEVDKNGNWTVDVPVDNPLKAGDTITAKQIDKFGKEKTATTTVIAKAQPEPIPTPDYNPWWPIWFGSTKTEAKPEPKLLERHEEYIAGYPDGTVRPDGKITRAEVAAIFARLTEKHTLAEFVARFTDVKSTDWFADSIMKLSGKDIITGYPDGTFKPNKSITRAEFAAIASKYIKNPKAADETFSDVPMNHWAKDAIAMVKAEGWISGYTDGTFKPDAPITRAEAVSIVNRMFDRAADGEFVREHRFEIKSFKDLVETHWAYYEIMEAVHTHDYERIGTRAERWEKIVK